MKIAREDLEEKFKEKDKENVVLRKSVEDNRKKNEFKSNLEKSFESLQKQFQMKADELERHKRQKALEEKKMKTNLNR